MTRTKAQATEASTVTDAPTVSVVIPALNESAQIAQTIHRIRQAFAACPELAAGYDITVCDNGSEDDTARVAAQTGCRVVHESTRRVAQARNTGAAATSGEWLLFIDADTWPPPELIADVASLLSDHTCIGCGSTIKIIDGPRWYKLVWHSKNRSMRTFKWCPGAFILCRRNAFDTIGGFSDEHYVFEELDFVQRLKALAKTRNQTFRILHQHPFHTSGRKGADKGLWWHLKLAFRLTLFHRSTVRDPVLAKAYYEPSG